MKFDRVKFEKALKNAIFDPKGENKDGITNEEYLKKILNEND